MNVPVGATISLEQIDGEFHDVHRTRYGHATPGAPVEFVNLRLAALGRIATAETRHRTVADKDEALLGTRTVVFDGAEPRDAGSDARLAAAREPPRGAGRDRGAKLDHDRASRDTSQRSTTHGNILITRA